MKPVSPTRLLPLPFLPCAGACHQVSERLSLDRLVIVMVLAQIGALEASRSARRLQHRGLELQGLPTFAEPKPWALNQG
eukprot:15467899-Alexandrium_andersonii.AAC.1